MPTQTPARTPRMIEILDNLTLLHSRTSAILAALSMAFDSQQDRLPKPTVQEVLEATNALLEKAQEQVRALEAHLPS
ncbi:hypothetical protein QN379_08665 [Glaciimonas sp. Gout2]|uniref:hypothetical protein n=1 Tax=unclassified Glaciimonas TaxID=2644401 RepID=UPI002B239B89|nr:MULTISPECIES: hypothetical protein [unclassified Glaciimonas]MEB0010777.1 hypothetical protein [Glaciimonas sp. Cout2]MEB0082087.1 hypothetical protein [Glaciimonas sp. Gout2]